MKKMNLTAALAAARMQAMRLQAEAKYAEEHGLASAPGLIAAARHAARAAKFVEDAFQAETAAERRRRRLEDVA